MRISDWSSDVCSSDLTGIETGYPAAELRQWAGRARQWAAGGDPDDLPRIEAALGKPAGKRAVSIYFLSAAQERHPAAAMALLRALGARPAGLFARARSGTRPLGKECVSTCHPHWSPPHS